MTQPWGQLLRRDHVLVLGMPGSGKTPFATELVEGGPLAASVGLPGPAARRVVFFDPTGEWRDAGERVQADDLADGELLAGGFLRLSVAAGEESLADDFAATVRACRAAAHHGGLVLLVDEVGDLSDGDSVELLRALHRNGHKDGVATILCSPCATDIPARCRSTATRVFSFFQKADQDVKALDTEYRDGFGTRANAWRYPAPPIAWTSPTLHA